MTAHKVILLSLAALVASSCDRTKEEKKAPPPPEVLTMQVKNSDVPIWAEWVATTDGYVNAKIRAQVTGYLVAQNYTEGSFVKKGDVLFTIDDRPFKAALDQAKGDLAQQEARLGKAVIDVNRYTPLAAEQAISQQELDDAIQAKLAAEAAVAAAKAVVENAQVNLGFTKVTSLIDGVAGLANAQIGDLVGPTGTELTAVSTVDPIKVYFVISEQDYLRWSLQYKSEAEMEAKSKDLAFDLVLSNGETWPHKGKFFFADRQVDVRTGSIRLAATFSNPRRILRPGQFGLIRTVVRTQKDVLLVPQRAVIEVQGLYQIMVLDHENKVSVRPITTGERIGSDWIILTGVEAGDTILVEGQQKVRPGMVAAPKPYVPSKKEQDAAADDKADAPKPKASSPPTRPPSAPAEAPAAAETGGKH
ncbi:MAG: efflux RND transporter periplasmic adaptor subunit [Phycisphaeraceae bacterium]|nr:efflux RND transporter periplasmic adaptor subunit [Phycisphaeraceae bacterium]